MKTVIKDIFFKMSNIQKMCLIFIVICHFYLKEIKFKNHNKLVCNVHDKENYVVHMRALKQALNHRIILKKVDRVIQYNE